MILFLKAHISAYTKGDGTFVAAHEDSRAPAKQEEPATVANIVDRVVAMATGAGLRVKVDGSRLSASTYVKIDAGGSVWWGKAKRRAWKAATGLDPAFSLGTWTVRVSDHHDYGGGSVVGASLRVDLPNMGEQLRAVEAAIKMLAEDAAPPAESTEGRNP